MLIDLQPNLLPQRTLNEIIAILSIIAQGNIFEETHLRTFF